MTGETGGSQEGALRGRVYLVTGAGSGLGRAVSLAFAAAGATMVLLDKEVAHLEAVYDEIEQAGGPQPAIFAVDLAGAQPEDYSKLAETLEEELGRLDGVVHAAAILGALAPLEHFSPETWDKVLRVNLTAPFLLTQPLLRLLQQGQDPTVTFVSDSVGSEPHAYWGAYGVSKAGEEALARMLGEETEKAGIRVNIVEPGPMRTPLQEEAFPAATPEELPDPAELTQLFLELVAPSGAPAHTRRLTPGDLPV
ncbi:SDR family NAD(P)-dependent oxidoreductase [Thiohalorhabdus sp. Cl-TMA]|uniref:SDR family NAD(P)-dependent oxidoreductase n=1 Tax=Thiohalorhabdus methylotrophus TaxID=3242694 RepID=A0ABV4TZD3_9GAMM